MMRIGGKTTTIHCRASKVNVYPMIDLNEFFRADGPSPQSEWQQGHGVLTLIDCARIKEMTRGKIWGAF